MLKAVGSNRIVNGGQLKYAAKNKNIVSIQCPINVQKNNFDVYDAQVAAINKAFVAFKGYYGDKQPLKKMFWICEYLLIHFSFSLFCFHCCNGHVLKT